MALIFKFDDGQLERLISAINGLSNNLGKWQGEETSAITQGFANLSGVLSGTSEEQEQTVIDQLAGAVNTVKDKLQTSVDSQTKGE